MSMRTPSRTVDGSAFHVPTTQLSPSVLSMRAVHTERDSRPIHARDISRAASTEMHGDSRAVRRCAARQEKSTARTVQQRHDQVLDREAGMATAEYAIATLAAVGFAALLVAVLSSGEIKGLLMSLITSALNFG